MKPRERENQRYAAGETNLITVGKQLMFSLLPSPPGKLLDVGCGVGTVTKELQKRGFEVVGGDFSDVAVQRCKEIGVQAIVCDVDAEGLPFDTQTFDVVWCSEVLEHVFDPFFLLEEIRRVLKRDGVVLISIPNDLYLSTRLRVLIGKSPQSMVYRKYQICKHHTIFSKELLEYMLKSVGFKIISLLAICRIPKTNCRFVAPAWIFPIGLMGETIIAKATKRIH